MFFIVPGPLATRTGGYEYDRRMIDGLRALGWCVETRELDGECPCPNACAPAGAAAMLASLPDGALAVVDGLALRSMSDQIERESARLRIVALVHMLVGAETGLGPDVAAQFLTAERRALKASALVVVTGRSVVGEVTQYGVAESRVLVVEPGTDPAPIARGSSGGPLRLLCVATVNRGKGHAILFRALASLSAAGGGERAASKCVSDWRLTCAGSLTRDPETVRHLRGQLQADHLEDHITLSGEVDRVELDALYDAADVFVLPTLHETYGMAVAEALARGLPVVSTRTGAIPDLVGDEAGLLAAPGDAQGFSAALGRVMSDSDLRQRLTGGARRARSRLRRWEDAVGVMSRALTALSSDDGAAR
jgi:glycosyltransferase involved in cell wall biosynthesis